MNRTVDAAGESRGTTNERLRLRTSGAAGFGLEPRSFSPRWDQQMRRSAHHAIAGLRLWLVGLALVSAACFGDPLSPFVPARVRITPDGSGLNICPGAPGRWLFAATLIDTAGRYQSPAAGRVTWAVRDSTLVALEPFGATVRVVPQGKSGATWLVISYADRQTRLQDSTRLWLLCVT